jgi:hypothetical protein
MRHEPDLPDAVERTYGAALELLSERLDLLAAVLETRLRTQGLGAAAAFAGWIYLTLGLVDGLAERFPRFALEVAVGVAHAGIAVLLLRPWRASHD